MVGGITNGGTLTLNHVTVRGNVTPKGGVGGGIWNYGALVLNSSTVSGNAAIDDPGYFLGIGGGIYNTGSTLTLNNSTVSGNTATHGGAIYNHAGGMSRLNNATVSDNRSHFGYVAGILNAGTLQARNTIVAGNAGTDLSGSISSLGLNVIGATSSSGFLPTDLVKVHPLLGPLQDNGGSIPTMAPWPDSPAVNVIAGTPGVDFPAVDARGIHRPEEPLADTGAVELCRRPVRWIR